MSIDKVTFSAKADLEARASSDAMSLAMTAYGGGIMRPTGVSGPCVVDLGKTTWPAQVPLLVGHDDDLAGLAGYVRPTARDGKLHASGRIICGTPDTERIRQIVKAGGQLEASIGMAIESRQYFREGDSFTANGRTFKAGPEGLTLVAGTIREISLVVLGADPETVVSIKAREKRTSMPTTVTNETDPIQVERERCTAIRNLCGEGHSDIEAKAVQENWTAEQTEIAVLKARQAKTELELLRASRPTGPAIHGGGPVVADRSVLEAAALMKLGHADSAERHYGEQACQRAEEMRFSHIRDIFAAGLQADGLNVPRDPSAMLRAAASSLSVSTTLGNTANKLLMDGYNDAQANWRAICAIKSAANFKEHTGIQLTAIGDLSEVAGDGELKHGSLTEVTYPYKISTFGKILGITRKQMIDDDLGAFDDAAVGLGKMAARKVSDLVFTLLLANTGSYFHADNSNYISGATTTLSSTSLATAATAMITQVDSEGRTIDMVPKTLLVPPELWVTGKELLSSTLVMQTDAGEPMGNGLNGLADLVVEPRLSNSAYTGYSAKAWYLFAAANNAPLIVAFLNGRQHPTVEFHGLDSDVNTLAVHWRVYHDVGVAFADPRAAVKSKGEA